MYQLPNRSLPDPEIRVDLLWSVSALCHVGRCRAFVPQHFQPHHFILFLFENDLKYAHLALGFYFQPTSSPRPIKMDEEVDALATQLSQFRLGFGKRATRPSIFTINQPANSTQTSCRSRPADERRLSYLSLPGEIRNQIMLYALVPGFIHLPAPTLYKTGQSELGPLSELKLRPPRFNAPSIPVSNNRKRRRSSASNSPLPDPDLRGHFYPPKPVKRTQESLKIARSWYKGRRKPS